MSSTGEDGWMDGERGEDESGTDSLLSLLDSLLLLSFFLTHIIIIIIAVIVIIIVIIIILYVGQTQSQTRLYCSRIKWLPSLIQRPQTIQENIGK